MNYRSPENYGFEERMELLRSVLEALNAVYTRYKCFIDCNPVYDPRLTEGVPRRLEEMFKKYSRILEIIEKPERKRKNKLFRIREKLGLENVTIKSNLHNKFLDVKQLEEINGFLNQALEGEIEKDILNYQNLPAERRGTDDMTEEDVKKTSSLGEISAVFWLWENPEGYRRIREKVLAEKSNL